MLEVEIGDNDEDAIYITPFDGEGSNGQLKLDGYYYQIGDDGEIGEYSIRVH